MKRKKLINNNKLENVYLTLIIIVFIILLKQKINKGMQDIIKLL